MSTVYPPDNHTLSTINTIVMIDFTLLGGTHVSSNDPAIQARFATSVATFVSTARAFGDTVRSGQIVCHPLCARLYVKQAVTAESKGLADQRRRMLAGLTGDVVEVGAGNGLNVDHYPATVSMVKAFEPEPYLRALAEQAAERAPLLITVEDAVAENLPLATASMDAAVASLVLCSVNDLDKAVAELHRVIRPGGELRFNEHVVAQRSLRRTLQRAADATVWPTLSGGCHLGRDTVTALEGGGFRLEQIEQFEFSVSALDPKKTHVLGTARRV